MKEIKINFDPKFCQQVGKVPVFNEKPASTLRMIVTIPFAEMFGDPMTMKNRSRDQVDTITIKRLNRGEMVRQMMRRKYEDCCGCSRPDMGDLLEKILLSGEEQLHDADTVVIKRLSRGEPMRNKYKE